MENLTFVPFLPLFRLAFAPCLHFPPVVCMTSLQMSKGGTSTNEDLFVLIWAVFRTLDLEKLVSGAVTHSMRQLTRPF